MVFAFVPAPGDWELALGHTTRFPGAPQVTATPGLQHLTSFPTSNLAQVRACRAEAFHCIFCLCLSYSTSAPAARAAKKGMVTTCLKHERHEVTSSSA